ncbi:hypothetical protein BV25DRAFT_1799680 [Artomyces pyxidatus]|uniref:Uncharacterized protein n=1 Tax=Artomyces pyxidatus TaxID=48021 RepID=A0ACB8TAF2_9AGAM|nr:hypothetical protein BV25DRAFT_1799680 [Artomyces pyxidatus]
MSSAPADSTSSSSNTRTLDPPNRSQKPRHENARRPRNPGDDPNPSPADGQDISAQDRPAPEKAPRSARYPRRQPVGDDRRAPRPEKANDSADRARAHHTHSPKPDSRHAESSRSGPSRPAPYSNKRSTRFNGKLSERADKTTAGTSHVHATHAPQDEDLVSTLTRALSIPPYQDCAICFSSIHPAQPSWSCSPTLPAGVSASDSSTPKEAENAQCCWTTFHLKCIKSWAAKSVKEVADAWRARGEERPGEWRCPGCQLKRDAVPRHYTCFCGSTNDPKLSRLATCHSCGNSCSRPRGCGHHCPLACHPGPCPPCKITVSNPCHCGKAVISSSCSRMAPRNRRLAAPVAMSCGELCGKMLSCGNHACADICHEGDCTPCQVREIARCWCGKEEKEMACGDGEVKESANLDGEAKRTWFGRFACENSCDRPFDCGIHRCSNPCHPPSATPSVCPRSVSLITHCPCGKHELSDPASTPFFRPNTQLIRTKCTDPIPTCTSLCLKPLEGCDHACSVPCHTGPCPPCSISLVRPCRCGSTTREVSCSTSRSDAPDKEIVCGRRCGALRACGRHQCSRLCCPLAALAGVKKKGRRAVIDTNQGVADEAGWHECDLVCGKPLTCGNHMCEERDHKGSCPPCLQSSYEELVCHCGRTIIEPPIPCGTHINCNYPCVRPPPECGHEKSIHSCHEDSTPCPPCVFLTSKRCVCGKTNVDYIQCSQKNVFCGTPCGKLLGCGFHRCERLCHGDACGSCTAVCGKPRKLCSPSQHPCTQPCHAPSVCPEAEPCRAIITITCPCGRIRQPVPCGRSDANPAGREGTQQLKCSNECAVAKRNARLAEALGINMDARNDKQMVYSDELTAFARANVKFMLLVEKTFADFVKSDKKLQVLPHMPENRRKFVHDLAAVYRIDTQMVDQEPHRSVQLIRRIDTRVPSPTLSGSLPSTPSNGLGKLADLRTPVSQWPRVQSMAPAGTSTGKGWTAVVAQPAGAKPPAAAPAIKSITKPGAPSLPASAPRPAPVEARPAPAPAAPRPVSTTEPATVPENWEDDV